MIRDRRKKNSEKDPEDVELGASALSMTYGVASLSIIQATFAFSPSIIQTAGRKGRRMKAGNWIGPCIFGMPEGSFFEALARVFFSSSSFLCGLIIL